jgi:hypothetical protein
LRKTVLALVSLKIGHSRTVGSSITSIAWCRWAGVRRVFHWDDATNSFLCVKVNGDSRENQADNSSLAPMVRTPFPICDQLTNWREDDCRENDKISAPDHVNRVLLHPQPYCNQSIYIPFGDRLALLDYNT